MEVESVPIDKLLPDPSNARKHDDKNLTAIKGSLAKFGQQKPIVVGADNVVIAGNGTLEAAKVLGWDTIDVVRSKLKGADAIAYALADNRTTDLSEWDPEVLSKQLQGLYEDDYAIAEIGFDPGDFDITEQSGGGGNTEDDEIPEVEENIHGVKRGDIWQLGEHRVMCGDSTSKDDVERLMQSEKADIVFTDPPYGMDLDTDYSKMAGTGNNYEIRAVDTFDVNMLNVIRSFAVDSVIFGADYFSEHISKRNEGAFLVWDKKQDVDTGADLSGSFGSDFELAWCSKKIKRKIYRVTSVTGFRNGITKEDPRVHPTQKPIRLIELILDDLKDKNLIVDLFLGSGSTLIACEKTNRKCYGMEIDPHYCSVIIERWQNYTGKTAIKTGPKPKSD